MRINIYYGGRGLVEDPTIYVIGKLQQVLEELRVEVVRINLFEEKNNISSLPTTLKDVDGIILAVSVEWIGIGGLMQEFLDACWLYGNKEKISKLYMMPVVMATTYGERDAENSLIKAWEILGGIPYNGLCAYVENHVDFELNTDYSAIIEKQAEQYYRIINQKVKILPSSNNAVKKNILKTKSIDLTPQESEQLSRFVSDDTYVRKQKEDIEELAEMFKNMLGQKKPTTEDTEYISNFKSHFYPSNDVSASFRIDISDKNKSLVIDVNKMNLKCYYGEQINANIIIKANGNIMNNIVNGRMTFQRAFMSGEITVKGDFKTLRMLDQIFRF